MSSNLHTAVTFVTSGLIRSGLYHEQAPPLAKVREGAQYGTTHLLLYKAYEPRRKHVAAIHLLPYLLRAMNLVFQRLVQLVLCVRIHARCNVVQKEFQAQGCKLTHGCFSVNTLCMLNSWKIYKERQNSVASVRSCQSHTRLRAKQASSSPANVLHGYAQAHKL
jgi:hypothetical protein